MHRHALSLLTLLFTTVCAAGQGQTVAEILQQFPHPESMLPETTLESARSSGYQDFAKVELVEGPGDGDGKAAHVEVNKKPPSPWNVQIAWTCQSAVKPDDTLLFTFRARNLSPKSWGRCVVDLVFRRASRPRHNALGDACPIWGGWREYAVPFSPDVSYEAGDCYMIMNFGAERQKVEIADVHLYNYGDAVGMGRLAAALGDHVKAVGRKKIGKPLSPTSLWKLGAFSQLPDTDPNFSPDGNWTSDYLIWVNRGWVGRTMWDIGYLGLQRKAGEPFTLNVDQRICNMGAVLHKLKAEIECRNDRLATPMAWTVDSEMIGPEGEQRDQVRTHEVVQVNDGQLRVREGNGDKTRDVPEPFTSDPSLFEAVQRLPFKDETELQFHLLHRLNYVKRDHHIVYRGKRRFKFGDREMVLHQFHQIGHGILPWDYWLDDSHRLIFAITHSRAYILCDRAEERMKAFFADWIRWTMNRKKQRESGGKNNER